MNTMKVPEHKIVKCGYQSLENTMQEMRQTFTKDLRADSKEIFRVAKKATNSRMKNITSRINYPAVMK